MHELGPGTQALRCLGDLDLVAAPLCGQAALRATAPRLVLDLRGLAFLDSSGLAVLLTVQRRHPGGRLATCIEPGGPVARVLDLGGVLSLLQVHTSMDEALVALAPVDAVPPPTDLDPPSP
ncbi:STAS domain-containing protein [Paraconexibacter antarcticus]|uniref:STAS domain-containing protein n=1 Tax=Paraconexibacter antarcticus TaxID=2949664 RepID=A0ABY5E105_9ACTN|nr:STAS domain-containing protein [Paraconexibacter antarcticus]UTI66842.1 STAS domain-containing protein [Paraconexibacter antarcticus]